MEIFDILNINLVPSAAKYPLPPKGSRFGEENILRYQDLCYVNPEFYKLNTFRLL